MNREQWQKLTNDMKNDKVAKYTKWKSSFLGYEPDDGRLGACAERYSQRPNYIKNLNAMHEAEKMLTKEQWVSYGQNLDRIGVFPVVHATAEQRAEAFVLTIEEQG